MTDGEPTSSDVMREQRLQRNLKIVVLGLGSLILVGLGAVMVKVIGTAGSTRYSYRDHVEIKPGLVHSQTYTAYQGSVMNEVRHFLVESLRMGEPPLSTLDDAITAQKMIEAAEKSIAEKSVVTL